MKISFETKILLGFIVNLLVVIASGWIFISQLDERYEQTMYSTRDWIELSLFILSIILLTIVYYIIKTQLRAKKISQDLLSENRLLLQSIIDNTTNPIFIKKINGEYLLVNKQYEALFHVSGEEIIGKTDRDFLPEATANGYRDSDLEVVKLLKELKTEETIQQADGLHTYISVKFPLFDKTGRVYAIGGIATDITDRKKDEESIKAADKFFKMALDVMVIASKDRFIKINPALSILLGYSEEELLSKPFLSFVHPEDHETTQKEIGKLQMGALAMKFENRWICKDGSIKWLAWSASPDVVTGLLYAIASDITALKENLKSLSFAEKFFNLSYDMFVVAKGDHFIKVNPAFIRILGYDQKEMDDKRFLSFTHPDDLEISIEALKKMQKGNSLLNHRARARCKDGSYKWLDWTSTLDLQTGIMYAVARDVTELMENEESLKMANTFFNLSFDILTVAKDEHFIKINPSFTKTLGYNQKDLDKINFKDLIHPDDRKLADEVLAKLMEGESAVSYKGRFLCKDGKYKWLDWNSNIDRENKVLYSVARNITKRVQLEEEQQKTVNELYENEEKLRLILENIGDGVIVANTDKKVIMANYMANAIFGIEEDDQISSNITNHFELFFPDGSTVFPSQYLPMERALNGETTNDVDIVLWDEATQEKRRVLMSGRPLVDQDDNVVAAVVTIKDISKYKKLEEELKETESKYRRLIGFKKGGDLAV